MARNRQRAKQRQAARRAERLARQGATPPADAKGRRRSVTEPDGRPQSAATERSEFELEAGAPPEEVGRSDIALESEPGGEEEPLEDYDPEDEEQPLDAEAGAGAVAVSREEAAKAAAARERGKVLGFLANVWAELQRVQWPKRQQLTTLTGVVLGFVLIAGGYLGLLDAIFSRVIQAIL